MAVVEHRSRHMASEVHAIVNGEPNVVAEAGRLIEDRLGELERSWSRFLPGSDVSRLNTAAGEWIDADGDTMTLLVAMRLATELTGGAYDPTVLPALLAAGYTHSVVDSTAAPALPGGAATAPAPGLASLELDTLGGRARIGSGVAVDPGGVGKGLAADLVAGDLLAGGAVAALVSVGGDLRTVGSPPGDRWSIRVEHPDDPMTAITTLDIDTGGVATSTTRSRPLVVDGRKSHHVIDPRTGRPTDSDVISATVVAPTTWQAEALATAALVQGAAGAYAMLSAAGTPAVLLTVAGEQLRTPDLIEPDWEVAR